MRINWNYIKGFFLLALVVFLYGFSQFKNERKLIKDVIIEFESDKDHFMNFEMVNKLLIQNNRPLKNVAKSVIDLHGLEAKVLAHPMVEDASVYLTIDGILKAKVIQRTPIARVITGSGSYYIDKQAERMPLSDNHSARVLLVSGVIDDRDNSMIYQLVTAIQNDDFLKKQIVSIQKLPDDEFILETRVGDQEIILGNLDDLYQKFKNLKSFYARKMEDGSIDKYSVLNLKYSNQVVCTKK